MATHFNELIADEGVSVGASTATAAAGAATLNEPSGVVTSEALTTAAGAVYTLTLTNSHIDSDSVVLPSVANGTSDEGSPAIGRVQVAAGSAIIVVHNLHATEALNGTIKVSFVVINPA